MSAIVTGGAGFIGSHLVDVLAASGQRVHVIDDLRWQTHTFAKDAELPEFTYGWPRRVSTQWRSIEEVERPAFDPDVIYHLAGPVGPVGVLAQAGRIVPSIVNDAQKVAKWATYWGCPLVYVSTSEVYGLQQQPMTEQAPRIIAAGHSARMEYAVAKMAAETMLLNIRGLDVRIIRPFNVAGPRQREEGGFVLPRFIRQAKAGESLTVYGDGTQRRAFTHVLDIVDGIVRAGTIGQSGEVYNLGNPANECSINDLAVAVLGLLGKYDGTVRYVDPRELWGPAFHEAPDKVPDITKAREQLGWEPTRNRATVILDAAGMSVIGDRGPEFVGRAIVSAIRDYERRNGNDWRRA